MLTISPYFGIVQNNNHTARFEAFGNATAIDTTASNGVFIRYNGSNRVHFEAGGNVGIGVDSPSAKLEVAATATTSVDIAHFSNSNVELIIEKYLPHGSKKVLLVKHFNLNTIKVKVSVSN